MCIPHHNILFDNPRVVTYGLDEEELEAHLVHHDVADHAPPVQRRVCRVKHLGKIDSSLIDIVLNFLA